MIKYLGLFKLPDVHDQASRFGYGGECLAAKANTLLISGHEYDQLVAEVNIPAPVKTKDLSKANTAKIVKPFKDITHGILRTLGEDMRLGGIFWQFFRVFWTAAKYYNVDGEKIPSLWRDAEGPWLLGDLHPHRVSQYIIEVPSRWRNQFGTFLVGRTNRPGYGNREFSSEGPCAYNFTPWSPHKRKFLDYYVTDPFKYTVQQLQHKWKGANSISGGVFTETSLIYIARVGSHPTDWYGYGPDFPGPGDPDSDDKGFHAPPYHVMAWSFDPQSILDGKPRYTQTNLSSYFLNKHVRIGGMGYHRASKRLYITEKLADPSNEFEPLPVVHVFEVS